MAGNSPPAVIFLHGDKEEGASSPSCTRIPYWSGFKKPELISQDQTVSSRESGGDSVFGARQGREMPGQRSGRDRFCFFFEGFALLRCTLSPLQRSLSPTLFPAPLMTRFSLNFKTNVSRLCPIRPNGSITTR